MVDVKNFYHPLHEIFTFEYGWIPIDRLYERFKNGEALRVSQFDLNDLSFKYTSNFEVLYSRVRSCTYHFGIDNKSLVQFNVHPNCQVLVSVDGGDSFEFITSREIHTLQQDGHEVNFLNLFSLYDLRYKNTLRLYTNPTKRNYTLNNGILYSIANETGATLTRYNGRVTVVGSYFMENENEDI